MVSRLSLAEARASALARLTRHGGFRDRRTGAFAIPDADAKEPERTERLLASPFAMRRARTGDAFQGIEGHFFFRVNGSSRIGTCYRLLVIFFNVTFGILSGLQPLLPVGSLLALAQTTTILTMQLGLAFVCFSVLPDADRIISRFAGAQFLFESLSTASLLVADRRTRDVLLSTSDAPVANFTAAAIFPANTTGEEAAAANASSISGASSAASGGGGGVDVGALRLIAQMQLTGFVLSLLAMSTPIAQLMEQRLLTPLINLIRNRGANPLVLLAAAYMLAASLPRMVRRLMMSAEVGATSSAQAAAAASADAGDDTLENQAAAPLARTPTGTLISAEDCCAEDEACLENLAPSATVDLTGDILLDVGTRVSRLLARAIAAKEVGRQNLSSSVALPAPAPASLEAMAEDVEWSPRSAPLASGSNLMRRMRGVAIVRAQQSRLRKARQQAGHTEDIDDGVADDDGGD